jgi:hypothetical protein
VLGGTEEMQIQFSSSSICRGTRSLSSCDELDNDDLPLGSINLVVWAVVLRFFFGVFPLINRAFLINWEISVFFYISWIAGTTCPFPMLLRKKSDTEGNVYHPDGRAWYACFTWCLFCCVPHSHHDLRRSMTRVRFVSRTHTHTLVPLHTHTHVGGPNGCIRGLLQIGFITTYATPRFTYVTSR